MRDPKINELKKKAICTDCVGEPYLQEQIKSQGTRRLCCYCGEKGRSYTLEEMSDHIESAFDSHYTLTPADMDGFEWAMHKDPEIDYDWERRGEPTNYAIMNAAVIEESAANDIQAILADRHSDIEMMRMGEETAYADSAYYEEIMPGDGQWRESWRDFERSLKSEARFFSRTAADQLSALFDDIGDMRTRSGKPLIVDAGPGTALDHLFRARVFQSTEKLKKALERPDRELASPPSYLAAAGRMNAKGISTFYGATSEAIALAEVRPPVGSEVATARFKIIRPLRMLDLNALTELHEQGSIFDPAYADRLGRMMFLRSLCARISRPVMPDDQDMEYLPTQAIADYLATEAKVPLDGILFPSVQAGGEGLNAVLFHKASRCLEMELPPGTELESSTEREHNEGFDREYVVIERVPAAKPKKKKAPASTGIFDVLFEPMPLVDEDIRDPALSIDTDAVRVHVIESVSFKTDEHSVRRHRWTKDKGNDDF